MQSKNDIKLARLLHYILGRQPDEFGLVPDDAGYVPLKDLMKVLHEEKWSHVRPAHLESLPYRVPQAGIEMDQKFIRASHREHLPKAVPCTTVPKELFTCIRRKAYMAVSRSGLVPQHHPDRVVLFAEREMALRVGRRRDAHPLVVTVQTTVAQDAGIQFDRLGATVFLTTRIPSDCCRLPAPPRPVRTPQAPKDNPPSAPSPEAGSYTLDWERLSLGNAPPAKRTSQKSKQWRRERQRVRRMKRNAGEAP
ncbi:MAG: RNA 2'-phosphotransferase [Desulfobacterales bacterium]|nr:RNA 2'-phosphotransferase [Desulfobacterales bacterium]